MDLSVRVIARSIRNRVLRIKQFEPDPKLVSQWRQLPPADREVLRASLITNYFTYLDYFPDPPGVYLATEEGRSDLESHILGRLDAFRSTAIPWISSFAELSGASILEIGCGTGSSTVALAEQGASVFATDVHAGSLQAAKDRLACFRLSAEFAIMNAAEMVGQHRSSSFDLVALFAVLEHMTLKERLAAISGAWSLLKPGGHLVVIEAPNRLWYFDSHTTSENFFHWLPDDLAVRWSPKTRRARFNTLLDSDDAQSSTKLARWGRGVSFHEFSLALELSPELLPIESCMELFLRKATNQNRAFKSTPWRRYEKFLSERAPTLHRGFFLPWIDVALRKPS